VLVIDRKPRDHGELVAFVAHYGARIAQSVGSHDLEAIAVSAVAASRNDPSLARMLPVFLWRIRHALDAGRLITRARRRGVAAALGYFLEVAGQLGSWRGFDGAIERLRRYANPQRPRYFFRKTASNPFEAFAATSRTPAAARRWGLLTGTPTDSFASYFRKASGL
jgi:hypothetical protein